MSSQKTKFFHVTLDISPTIEVNENRYIKNKHAQKRSVRLIYIWYYAAAAAAAADGDNLGITCSVESILLRCTFH